MKTHLLIFRSKQLFLIITLQWYFQSMHNTWIYQYFIIDGPYACTLINRFACTVLIYWVVDTPCTIFCYSNFKKTQQEWNPTLSWTILFPRNSTILGIRLSIHLLSRVYNINLLGDLKSVRGVPRAILHFLVRNCDIVC